MIYHSEKKACATASLQTVIRQATAFPTGNRWHAGCTDAKFFSARHAVKPFLSVDSHLTRLALYSLLLGAPRGSISKLSNEPRKVLQRSQEICSIVKINRCTLLVALNLFNVLFQNLLRNAVSSKSIFPTGNQLHVESMPFGVYHQFHMPS